MIKCDEPGCIKDAEWEVEFLTDPPHGQSFRLCDDHCPANLIGPCDNIKRLDQTVGKEE